MKNYVIVGIQVIMARKGLVQKSVAERSGFSEQQFSDMMNGRKIIRVEHLPPIAAALGVDVCEICNIGMENMSEDG